MSVVFLAALMSCQVDNLIYVSERVQSPVITPLGGVFYDQQLVELSCPTPGATIVYTTDGTNPTRVNGSRYTSRFYVNQFAILKVLAYAENLNDSIIVRSAYSFKVSGLNFFQNSTLLASDPIFPADAVVQISNSTPDSTIYYTTDGTTPTSASNIYTAPLTMAGPVTIKAVAFKFGWAYSETKTMNFGFKAEPPAFFPAGNTFDAPVYAVITPSLSGAAVYYTVDGTTPTAASPLYTAPILISQTTTLKAIATRPGMTDSAVAQVQYTLQAKTPDLTPAGGLFNSAPMVTLQAASGATVYYTTDGSAPTQASPVYSAPISVTDGMTVSAVAYQAGLSPSAIGASTYHVNPALSKLSPPTANQPTGAYTNSVTTTLTSPDNATIKYTLDGTTPSQLTGTTYEAPIVLDTSATLKAVCVQDGFGTSDLLAQTYTVSGTVLPPELLGLTDGQTLNSAAPLEVNNPTAGAVVHFTLNGTDPTENDSVYNGPVSLVSGNQTLAIRLKAFKPGWTPSSLVSCTVTFALPAPHFNPLPGTSSKVANVILSQSVLGASTRYTLDGTNPTATTGLLYNKEIIVLNATTTIKMLSFKPGWADSPVAQGTFTISP